jgi:hypothetical protein
LIAIDLWGAVMDLGIVAFVGAICVVAALNLYKPLQKALAFNRPMPAVDSLTLAWIVGGGVLVCAQGLFSFSLNDLMPHSGAWIIYALIGFSAVWQGSRQN